MALPLQIHPALSLSQSRYPTMVALKSSADGRKISNSSAGTKGGGSRQIDQLKAERISQIAGALKALEKRVGDHREISEDEFSDIVVLVVNHYGVQPRKIAAALHVAPSAVSRWTGRQNWPRPYARHAVLSTIIALLRERLNETTAELR